GRRGATVVPQRCDAVEEARARVARCLLVAVGAPLGGAAAVLVHSGGDELVVGLQRLGDVAGCEGHDHSIRSARGGSPSAFRFFAEVVGSDRAIALSSEPVGEAGCLTGRWW